MTGERSHPLHLGETGRAWGQMMVSFECDKVELDMDKDGILQLRWPPHSIVGPGDAELAMQMVNEFCGTSTRPMLVDMTTTAKVSREAREVFSLPCQASPIALLGASPVDEVVANFVLAMNKTRPKRFFTSREEAMNWLKTATAAQS